MDNHHQVEQEEREHGVHLDLSWWMLRMVLETLRILTIQTTIQIRR